MAEPHDFDFQFGRNRSLRGRGWRGLLALTLVAIVVALTGSNVGTSVLSPLAGGFMHLISAPKIAN